MEITKDILYVGVNDHLVDLFEGQYDVPNGMAYNSYLIYDDKIAVMDSVDARAADEWLAKLAPRAGEASCTALSRNDMSKDALCAMTTAAPEHQRANSSMTSRTSGLPSSKPSSLPVKPVILDGTCSNGLMSWSNSSTSSSLRILTAPISMSLAPLRTLNPVVSVSITM